MWQADEHKTPPLRAAPAVNSPLQQHEQAPALHPSPLRQHPDPDHGSAARSDVASPTPPAAGLDLGSFQSPPSDRCSVGSAGRAQGSAGVHSAPAPPSPSQTTRKLRRALLERLAAAAAPRRGEQPRQSPPQEQPQPRARLDRRATSPANGSGGYSSQPAGGGAGGVRAGVAAAARAPGELLSLLSSSVTRAGRRVGDAFHSQRSTTPQQQQQQQQQRRPFTFAAGGPGQGGGVSPRCGGALAPLDPAAAAAGAPPLTAADESLERRVRAAMEEEHVDLGDCRDSGLRGLVWAAGAPQECRATCWMLLTGYLSAARPRRECDLARKRREYADYVQRAYHAARPAGDTAGAGDAWEATMRLIRKDVPRTAPEIPLFQTRRVQDSLERILFVWAFRHPACSYVQGMNDLALPFVYVFYRDLCKSAELLSSDAGAVERILDSVADEDHANLEADVYWCFKRHLEPIQDHYTENQPGIQHRLRRLSELLSCADPRLHEHFEAQSVQLIQFAYKWVNCLLVRELPLDATVRLWDTYMAEGEAFADLHVYVCLALLTRWSEQLVRMDFADMLQFLQSPPTGQIRGRDVAELVSSAYLLQQVWDNTAGARAAGA